MKHLFVILIYVLGLSSHADSDVPTTPPPTDNPPIEKCIELLDQRIINLESNNETVFNIEGCSEEQVNKDLALHLKEIDLSLSLVEFTRVTSTFTEVIEELKKTIPNSDTYTELRPITDFWSGTLEIKPNIRVDRGTFINTDGKNLNENFLAFFYTEDMGKLIMITKFVDSIDLDEIDLNQIISETE